MALRTVLEIAQSASGLLQLQKPSALLTSTDTNTVFLSDLIFNEAVAIRDEFDWPETIREHTFTLSNGVDSYALPADFDRHVFDTHWNRGQRMSLIGPVTPMEWQTYKSGLVATLPRQRFRVKGAGLKQFFLDSTPTASEDGQTCAFEHITRTVFMPKEWTASTSWAGIQYCSYNGFIFDRGSTGAANTGTTAPTPAIPNDGSIAWVLLTTPYEKPTHDTDRSLLDWKMLQDQVVWRFKEERGIDFERQMLAAESAKDVMRSKLTGASVVSVRQCGISTPMIGPWSYPVQDYGS